MRFSIEFYGRCSLILAPVILAASGCSSSGSGGAGNEASSAEKPHAVGQPNGAGQASIWQVNAQTDPMTDIAVTTAVASFAGQHVNLEVTVACGGTGKLGYQFRSFDQDNQPVAMRRFKNIFSQLRPALRVRLDGAQPYLVGDDSGRFANQVLLLQKEAAKIGEAKEAVVRIFPASGDPETYTLDQTDADLQRVLSGCASGASMQSAPAPVGGTDVGTGTDTGVAPTKVEDCWTPPSGQRVDDADRAMSADEITEIEAANGRPYQEGDTIWGKAEDRCRS